MLIKYWANATESGLPLIVIVRSVFPPSRSSQFEMRIMAPEIWRISAIFVPPLPIMQPIRSFGTVISWDWVVACWLRLFAVRNWDPANAANAVQARRKDRLWVNFMDKNSNTLGYVLKRYNQGVTYLWDLSHQCWWELLLLNQVLLVQPTDSWPIRTSVKEDTKKEQSHFST